MKGFITTYVLVFGSIFLILLSGLSGFILLQLKQANQSIAWNEALQIAEAGTNYYRWCLNNESEQNCSTQKDYYDASGNIIGQFILQIDSIVSCGQTIQKNIISTGISDISPGIERKVSALYARESIAKYSYILNDNVWIGSDHEIRGPYQSNGGIRMDGENQSLVTSAKETWTCTESFGCSPPQEKPGVFTTANGDENLFQFPVPPFDFEGITVDLAQMKSSAQSSGLYLPPSTDINPGGRGYHLRFLNNGNIEAWIITDLSSTYGYSMEEGWHYDDFTISGEYFYNTYAPNPGCPVFFVEDSIWPEGQVKGKITVASADLINPNIDTNAILPNNIDYTASDGSDGLVMIAENNILVGPQSPDQMELRGVLIAQKGRFSRNHYPNNIKDKLEISGSIASNERVGTQWVSGSQIVSGYRQRESYFDQNLIYSPPPFIPRTSQDFKIISWEEME